MACVPQAFTFLEGIWPPELVPLFLRDGSLPDYVDADELEERHKKGNKENNLTDDDKQALQAAISLSTFANGCLHRSICCTATVTANMLKGNTN